MLDANKTMRLAFMCACLPLACRAFTGGVPEVLLEVGPSATVSRASEGDVAVLKDGRWLLAYSEFQAVQSGAYAAHHDHAAARIVTRVSSDGGRTWSEPTEAVERERGDLNVMSVSFLRLLDGRLAMFYVRKRSESDARPVMRVSSDEGATWGEAVECVDDAHRDYYVLNNARAVRLSTGRILLPLCRHSPDSGDPQGFESEGRLCAAASDDDGASWRMVCEPFKVFDRLRSRVTVQEPGVVELKDGSLLMYVRTNRRAQWGLRSSDGGATWGDAAPLPLVSPNLAPATIARLADGNLVAVWNDYSGKSAAPDWVSFAEQREPFSVAWSKDDGRTWSESRTVEADPPGVRPRLCCCYFAVREMGDAIYVFHCHHNGLKTSHLTKIPLAWIYGENSTSVSAESVSLDGEWDFMRERRGGTWEKVEVPHDWAIKGPFDRKLSANTAMLPWTGVGHYRRVFMPPDGAMESVRAGARAYLEFDGVMARPAVKLNGRDVGGWDYGYSSFWLDVTDALKEGTNLVEVTADTRGHRSRWYPGAGIYRSVRLVVRGRDCAAPGTVRITAPRVSRENAEVRVEYETVGGKRIEKTVAVDRPRLWDVEDPHLYEIEIGGEKFRYGIRTAEFKADDGFWLNGRRVQLKGVNLHSDLGPVGMAFSKALAKRQLLMMKEMGANALRTSHNPPAPQLLDLCDELGILVWDEAFDKWGGHAGRCADENLEEYVGRNIEAMVRRDRNHPSVIVWSIANEIWPPNSKEPERVFKRPYDDGMTKERCALFRERILALDDTRPVAAGFCHEGYLETDHLAPLDLTGWNYGRRYAKMKAKYPGKPVVCSESASAFSTIGYYSIPPATGRGDYATNDVQVCSYDHCSSLGADIPDIEFFRLDKDPYCAGEFVWTGIDYLGEPSPFALNGARSSYFGICDLRGMPKDRYWLYRSRWNEKKETVHVLPHWSWKGREGENVPVYVYTSGDEAELFLNGRSLGRRRKSDASPDELLKTTHRKYAFADDFRHNPYLAVTDRYRLRWLEVKYEPGELRAVAYRRGEKIGERLVRTAGAAKALKLEVERTESPEDPFYVHASIVDAAGTPVPDGAAEVRFSVSGPGRVVAVANGDPTELTSFSHVSSYQAFNGSASAIVKRDSGGSGRLRIEVHADGLGSDSVEL